MTKASADRRQADSRHQFDLTALALFMQELMEESLAALSEVRTKVSRIAASPSPGLTEEESIFLSNVRYSLPDVLQFTRTQFRGAVADVRRTKW